MTRTLDEATWTPARHWNLDGLPEIEIGSFLFLWGGVMVAAELWPARVPRGVGAWAGMALAIALMLIDRLALPRLKARVTYPRIGYVRVRVSRARWIAALALGLMVAGGTAAWLVRARDRGLEGHDLPRALGALVALAMIYAAWRLGLARFYAYAAVAAALALASPSDISLDLGVGAGQMAVGAALLMGGAIAYRRLRQLPPAADDEEP